MPKLDRNPEACAYHEPDQRADGGTRTIRLSARGIRIDRALGGVKMRLAVPIEAYRGVVLTREDKLQRRFYRLTLDHSDADLSITPVSRDRYRSSDRTLERLGAVFR